MLHRISLFAALAIAALGVTSAASQLGWNPDAPGHLYVVERGAPGHPGQIAVFPLSARGNVSPDYVIGGPHTMLTKPYALAFDARGDTYAYNSGYPSACDQVFEFAPGASGDAKPIREIGGSETGFCGGGGYNLAVTPAGSVYVPIVGFHKIVVFSPTQGGNVQPEQTLAYVVGPATLNFDAGGNLWNSQDPEFRNEIDEYSPVGKPLPRIKEPGQVYLFAIAHNSLYAPAERQNIVTITNVHTLKTTYSFTYPRNRYFSVSVDGMGYMYFLYFPPRHQKLPPVVEIYAPGGKSPIGSLGGPLAGLDSANSALVGP